MYNEIDGLFKSDVDLKDKIKSFFEKHIRYLCKNYFGSLKIMQKYDKMQQKIMKTVN
mgnify:CR=1 FL=1